MSSSTLQRYRIDMNMLSPYRIPSKSNKENKKIEIVSITSKDLKRPQTTSNNPEVKPIESQNKMKVGGSTEVNDKFLNEIFL